MRFNFKRRKTVIIERKEDISSDFEGTIIDIETNGDFDQQYRDTNDSRQYQHIQQVIFGSINSRALHIFCAKGMEAISELKGKTEGILDSLERPFYAFQSEFERGVFFHHLGKKVNFDGELQKGHEPKKVAVRDLNIPNYDDPFYDNGFLCMKAWEGGEFDKAIAHNRACLLKERDILLKRPYREPNIVNFNK